MLPSFLPPSSNASHPDPFFASGSLSGLLKKINLKMSASLLIGLKHKVFISPFTQGPAPLPAHSSHAHMPSAVTTLDYLFSTNHFVPSCHHASAECLSHQEEKLPFLWKTLPVLGTGLSVDMSQLQSGGLALTVNLTPRRQISRHISSIRVASENVCEGLS